MYLPEEKFDREPVWLIQSKRAWELGDVGNFYSLARALGKAGNDVTFFLVQNGVMRRSHAS